jgi:MSHA biogenesis protein MshJ
MKKPDLAQWQTEGLKRWRQWRRMHAARTLSERRLLVVAGVALTWFLLDQALVTPGYQSFKTASTRFKAADTNLRNQQVETARFGADLAAMENQLKGEVSRMRLVVAQQNKDLEELQHGLVPAREMREVLDGLFSRHAQVRLVSVKTLSVDEARKAGMSVQDLPGLYLHGLDVTLQGSFVDLLAWLEAAEELPRKLLWSGMQLQSDEQKGLMLTVRMFTVSPDPDPLEILAP